MKPRTYYNENDPKIAAWLRQLIRDKLISDGDVDERSIRDVQPGDLDGYTRWHFFAGIGGWDYALQLAGWPLDQPVATGSCPCQPFSAAGRGLAESDERHLWPEFFRLIKERRFPVVFGEQVAGAAGRKWLAGVFADLDSLGYLRAGANLCAAGIGAPHKRQRIYWNANSNGFRMEGLRLQHGAIGEHRPWRSYRKMDLLKSNPLHEGKGWPQPLVLSMGNGLPKQMVRLHGYGNAIVPQLAAEFIIASAEAINDQDHAH